ncbi:unnamed protein product [Kuraishia capsulata CBS 1993]|uniref:NmrA-like domain-containing protein n=1 Tax=Kuraishia capsulata CBS 1993 TaxID=1382522 RepID=W6MFG0_9ASCO|nr:uncharacterized protein KUCA_T00000018001 [Kuraishia capsulata CBS 1993]CDK24058.1 unnamed protein product [Kuraishia capsulata CBS 1993]
MKVAIAGAGDVAKYQTEELLKKSIDVVVLSRSDKEWFHGKKGVELRIVDYNSVESLTEALKDCDGLVSMILDYSMYFATLHLNLIEAMLKTEKCRRFIPSEYGADLVKYPDQPKFYYPNHNPVREKLRSLNGQIEFALICCGWLNDYFIPSKNRYIKDLDDGFPTNLQTRTAVIPGTGDEGVAFISARDLTKCITNLFKTTEPWEEFIYVAGETTTWNTVAKTYYPGLDFKITYLSVSELVQMIVDGTQEKDDLKVINAEYQLVSPTNSLLLPADKLAEHRAKYFSDIHFRTNLEMIKIANESPDLIV